MVVTEAETAASKVSALKIQTARRKASMIVRDGRNKRRGRTVLILLALLGGACTKNSSPSPEAAPQAPAAAQSAAQAEAPASASSPQAAPAAYPPARPIVYADPKENREIQVSWMFNYVHFPGRVTVYEVDPDFSFDLGETRAAKKGEPVPFIRPLQMPVRLKLPGQLAMALAIENPTDQPWHFFANFHNYLPNDNGYGVTISCLCTNHIFEIPPHSTWYRIVNVRGLKIAKDASQITIKHDIIGLTAEEIQKRRLDRSVRRPEE